VPTFFFYAFLGGAFAALLYAIEKLISIWDRKERS
jgi:hypothetical protein